MPKLTLYRVDGACSIAAHMLLKELQLPFSEVVLQRNADGLYAGPEDSDLTRQAWLKISHTGYVPALKVDGENIIELSAILFYIASLAPERYFTGRTPLETARVVEWTSWLGTAIQEYGFAGRWDPERMVGKEASEEVLSVVREHGKEQLQSGFEIIDRRIQGNSNAVGEHLTVVDFMLHTFWRWGKLSGFDMEQYPKFKAVVKAVEGLPSVKGALRAESVELQFP